MATEQKTRRTIITPLARASYPNLVSPRKTKSGKEKYGMALIFEKGTDLKAMKKMALEALTEEYGEKTAKLLKAKKLHWPFRDEEIDVEEKGYPEGCTFINVNSERKPGTVNTIPDKDGKPSKIDPADIYPGCYVRASLDCFLFDVDGNKGVTFGLRNVQYVKDGDRLDGVSKAEDEFEADPDAVAGLDALTDDEDEANEDEDTSLDELLS